ncbi:hypothetical protein COCMIDRAFT_37595 [Bipolaris oryzae ATCC 44560]|uniref:Heterokaryon incompatibility domain-containing protein n=1 Tax=Bipolaris oryzae ATCC 44560 TaxID=930090 RepID=W6ZLZ8_COCMI|nr:uncharacterized protein COCMIDRAFT_37595 [Bipolaris oryzae ATCC 44560]EUC44606.1 hypothetical protein COCMIDRAFT_37595 [Bipolaris oryzae ATCC 44560]
MLSRDQRLSKRMQEADPALKEVDMDMLSYARKLFYFRHLANGGIGLGSVFVHTSEDAPGFLEAVVMARDFKSTDPRDKIFALWNLAQDKTGIDFKPHYTEPYERIYADFARAWINQKHSLDILGAVEASESSSSFYRKTPSWAPDWSVPTQTSCLVRKDYIPMKFISVVDDQQGKLYAADGGITRDTFEDTLLHFQDNVLHCTGLIIDQVGAILQQPPQISSETVHLQSGDPDWEFHCWTIELTQHFRNFGSSIYDDPLRAAWAMCHGDNTAAWPPNPDFKSPLDDPYTCQTELSKHVSAWVHGYRESEARNIVRQVLRGRRAFISEAGYMGLMPAYIADKWSEIGEMCHLAVIAGCSIPLVLRERDNETYTVLGACFVQGWMEGEWIETMMGAGSPTEFWTGMRGVAALRIT